MKLTRKNSPRVIKEVNWGLYVWEMPDGRWIGDDEGNFLNIPSTEGDLSRIKKLSDAVRSYGIHSGRPKFLAGHRQVTDEEYERQQDRMRLGLLPDEYDIPALIEEMNK